MRVASHWAFTPQMSGGLEQETRFERGLHHVAAGPVIPVRWIPRRVVARVDKMHVAGGNAREQILVLPGRAQLNAYALSMRCNEPVARAIAGEVLCHATQ